MIHSPIHLLTKRFNKRYFQANFWLQCLFILLLALVLFGPILNLLIWTIAERWYFPHALPTQ